MKLWRARDLKEEKPVLVDCPNGAWPNKDLDGIDIFVNTHFETQDEAWESLLSNARAGVKLAKNRVVTAEKRLEKARKDVVEEVKYMDIIYSNFESEEQ